MDERRVRRFPAAAAWPGGPVMYWMHRDFRAADNWSLLHTRLQALRQQLPVVVVVAIAPGFLQATLRQYDFLLTSLEQTATALSRENLHFLLLWGDPWQEVYQCCQWLQPSLMVTDFDPLLIKRQWLQSLREHLPVPVHQVDARNIVPCRLVSSKQEVAARTLRPKIGRLLAQFLTPFPELPAHPYRLPVALPAADFQTVRQSLRVDRTVAPVDWLQPGEAAARQTLVDFLQQRLPRYDLRNDPNQQVCSNLSPYLHFGMIAAQTVALAVQGSNQPGAAAESFLEELIVRRELAENFCCYNPDYLNTSCFPLWARQTLDRHRADVRSYLYSEEEFAAAKTHDQLWNAAQRQLLATGKMHAYMRMYWAKKILEWRGTPEQALQVAIRLNDRYALDGRDPNGYAGIAWSIGGLHDRPWGERPVFGTVRYMNAAGAARKFDVKRYINSWSSRQQQLFV